MKKETIEYYCDRCKKKISYSEHTDNRIVLYPKRGLFLIEYKEVHLCKECLKINFDFVQFFLK